VTADNSANFTITANGSPAPSYPWHRSAGGGGSWINLGNGGNYSGVTTTTLSVSGTTTGMSGDQFRCVATNTHGSDTSDPATLTVNGGSSGNGHNAQYFWGTDLSSQAWSGTVSNVDFDWGSGRPGYTDEGTQPTGPACYLLGRSQRGLPVTC
jgi:hypothetical protein